VLLCATLPFFVLNVSSSFCLNVCRVYRGRSTKAHVQGVVLALWPCVVGWLYDDDADISTAALRGVAVAVGSWGRPTPLTTDALPRDGAAEGETLRVVFEHMTREYWSSDVYVEYLDSLCRPDPDDDGGAGAGTLVSLCMCI